jgi:hypothetical protein
MPNGHAYDPVPIEEADRRVVEATMRAKRAVLDALICPSGGRADLPTVAKRLVALVGDGPLADEVRRELDRRHAEAEVRRAEQAESQQRILDRLGGGSE